MRRLERRAQGLPQKDVLRGALMGSVYTFPSNLNGKYGTVSGYFSSYALVPDCYGDVCKPGFLNESIKKRVKSGHGYPLMFHHDVNQIIGAVTLIEDRTEGVYMEADFLDTARAQEVRTLVKSGVVYQMSFAYSTQESGLITLPDGTKANELRRCELFEVTITPTPAQPLSVLTDVKSALEIEADRLLRSIEVM